MSSSVLPPPPAQDSPSASLVGVLGWPIDHSKSPPLHNHWLADLAIDAHYHRCPVHPDDLAAALDELRKPPWRGANLTMPHKQACLSLVDVLTDRARAARSVNTLIVREGMLIGDTTDGEGLLASLAQAGVDVRAGPILILGAGGASYGAATALAAHKAAPILISNRTRARAQALADHIGGAVIDWPPDPACLADVRLLIHATSLGMMGESQDLPSLEGLSSGAAVTDLIYAPLETPLLRAAAIRGCKTVNGFGMFYHQARLSFQLWFDVLPPVDPGLWQELEAL
ncbi:MAG: shikimate dehydrogenase [Pseudomonadota bacterium]